MAVAGTLGPQIACGLLVLIACVSLASSARAEPELGLSWSAPAACPDGAWARARIAEQLGRDPSAEVARGVLADVRIEPLLDARAPGFVLTLHTRVAGSAGERAIEGRLCTELAQAAALIIALSVSEAHARTAQQPAAAPAPASRTDRAPAARSAAHAALRAEAIVDLGFFAGEPGFGAALAFAYGRGIWRGELSALGLAPRTLAPDAPGAGKVEAWLWALRGAGCALFGAQRLRGGPCAGAEFGQARGRGTGAELAKSNRAHSAWIAALGGGRLSVGLVAGLALTLEADLLISVIGPKFVSAAAGGAGARSPVHEPAPAQLRANLGLELRF